MADNMDRAEFEKLVDKIESERHMYSAHDLAVAKIAAFKAGEASMRERAAGTAKACKPGFVSQFPDIAEAVKIADQYCDKCAEAISALKGAT